MKRLILLLAVSLVSLTAFASDVYCPAQLWCYGYTCSGLQAPFAVYSPTHPLQNDNYFFYKAMPSLYKDGGENPMQCTYKGQIPGNGMVLTTTTLVSADMSAPGKAWVFDQDGNFYCMQSSATCPLKIGLSQK